MREGSPSSCAFVARVVARSCIRFSSLVSHARAIAGGEKRPCYTGRMRNNILHTAIALTDRDLLARVAALAGTERETTAELVAHLAALELRPNLYLAQGYGSLFRYCTGALRFSEDAACNRIQAAHACRRFPVIVDLLAAGTLSLTAVRLLEPHLTAANHEAVLARAANGSKEDIEALVAELAPKPDVVSSVRKLPGPRETQGLPAPSLALSLETDPEPSALPRPDGDGSLSDPASVAPISAEPASSVDASRPAPTTLPTLRALSCGPCPPAVTGSSSRSGRRRTTSSAGCRPCCAARSGTGIRRRSSTGRWTCFARRSSRPGWARLRRRQTALTKTVSVLERIR